MKKVIVHLKSVLMISAMVLFCSGAYSEEGSSNSGGGGMNPMMVMGVGQGISQLTEGGSKTQAIGSAANSVFGTYMMAECTSDAGISGSCAMAVASFAMAGQLSGTSSQNDNISDITTPDWDLGGGDSGGIDNPNFEQDQNTTLAGEGFDVQEKLDELEKKGYSVDTETGEITLPNGESIPASALNSAAAMEEAGFSAEEARKTQALAREAAKKTKYKVSKMAISSRGGGGGSAPPKYEYQESNLDLKKLFDRKKKRKPASVAGMQKKVGSEPIGVKADDIFQMIHRRYQKKRKARVFVESIKSH